MKRWQVYLLFPGTREKLQGGFLEVFEVIPSQFSLKFPVEIWGKNNRISLYSELVSNCPQGSGPRGTIPGKFRDNSRKFPGKFRNISRKFPGNFQDISGTFPGNFQEISRKFPGNFREIFQEISSKFLGHFREISRKFPGNFREIDHKRPPRSGDIRCPSDR